MKTFEEEINSKLNHKKKTENRLVKFTVTDLFM